MADQEVIELVDDPATGLVTIGIQGPAGPVGPTGPSPSWAEELIVTLDGGAQVLEVGDTKSFYTVTFNGTIQSWHLVGDQSGDVVLDVWKAANAVPTNANSITGTEKPTLVAQQMASNTVLSSWTKTLVPNDVLGFEIESATGIKKATLVMRILKT